MEEKNNGAQASDHSGLFFDAKTINRTQDALTRITRLIFYMLQVTHNKFIELHSNMCQRDQLDPTKLCQDRYNTRNVLLNDQVKYTSKRVMATLTRLLGVEVLRIELTIRFRAPGPLQGKIMKIGSTDYIDKDGNLTTPPEKDWGE